MMPTIRFQDELLTISASEDGLKISVCPFSQGCTEDEWNTVDIKAKDVPTLYNFMKQNITGIDKNE